MSRATEVVRKIEGWWRRTRRRNPGLPALDVGEALTEAAIAAATGRSPGAAARDALLGQGSGGKGGAMGTKSGVQTSEFWVTLVAMVWTALLQAGVIPQGDNVAAIVSAVATLLVAVGYAWARAFVKARTG
jgi:hypothetical protein